jgi:hypothetical protein
MSHSTALSNHRFSINRLTDIPTGTFIVNTDHTEDFKIGIIVGSRKTKDYYYSHYEAEVMWLTGASRGIKTWYMCYNLANLDSYLEATKDMLDKWQKARLSALNQTSEDYVRTAIKANIKARKSRKKAKKRKKR